MIELTKEQADAIAEKAIELGLSVEDAIDAGFVSQITGDPEAGIKYLDYLWIKEQRLCGGGSNA